jgi:sec-independent protein translocase protein TatA
MGPIGFSEMLVIFIVALLVFGPKKMPELGKSLGKGIREFRKATDELKQTWEEQVREVENPVKDVSRDIQQVGNDMKADFYASDEPSPPPVEPSTTASTPAPADEYPAVTTTGDFSDESTMPQDSPEPSKPAERPVPKEHV